MNPQTRKILKLKYSGIDDQIQNNVRLQNYKRVAMIFLERDNELLERFKMAQDIFISKFQAFFEEI